MDLGSAVALEYHDKVPYKFNGTIEKYIDQADKRQQVRKGNKYNQDGALYRILILNLYQRILLY